MSIPYINGKRLELTGLGYYLDNFYVSESLNMSHINRNWLCIRKFAQNEHGFVGHKLMVGDILKVGRLVFGVTELCFQQNQPISVESAKARKHREVEVDYFIKQKSFIK